MSTTALNPYTGKLQLLANAVADIFDITANYLKLDASNSPLTGNLALGVYNLTLTGSISTTGSRVTKGWFTDLEVTNMPSVGGTSIQTTFDARYAVQANNLSDLDDIGTARTNLGLIAGGAGDIWVEKAGDTMSGNLLISKADPTLTLTDTGDSNSLIISRTDTLAVGKMTNVVSRLGDAEALTFDGALSTDPSVTIAAHASLNAAAPLSVFCWVAPDQGAGTVDAFIGRSASSVSGAWGLTKIIASDKIRFYYHDGVSLKNKDTTTMTVTDGSWNHVGVTLDGSGNLLIWVNGSSEAFTGVTLPVGSSLQCFMGLWLTNDYNGDLDEVAIWDKVLATTDVADLYNSGSGLYIDKDTNFPTSGTSMGTNLQGLWHLDEGTGLTAYDSSANTNDGTLNATAAWLGDGKVSASTTDVTLTMIQSEDGTLAGEGGIVTFGEATNTPSYIFNAKSLKVNIGTGALQHFSINNAGVNVVSALNITQTTGKIYVDTDKDSYLYSQGDDDFRVYIGGVNVIQAADAGGVRVQFGVASARVLDNFFLECGTSAGGAGVDFCLQHGTFAAPDTVRMGLPSESNGIIICERADVVNFDFGHALQTNPTVFIHSANQSTTQWIGLTHDQTNALITTGTGSIVLGTDSIIGIGTAGKDYTLTFDGETNDGVFTWMEDEDYFQFQDTVKTAGRIATVTAVSSSPYTVTAANHVMTAASATAAITFDLPAVVIGTIFIIKDIDFNASVNNITIASNGSETIDGSTSDYVISTDGGSVILIGVTGGWSIL